MLQIFAKKKKKGFTLIELLVVIAIIGILSSIVLVSMGGIRVSARNTARKAAMRQIVSGMEMYYGACDKYPVSATIPITIAAGSECAAANGTTFMAIVPIDPTNSGDYIYKWVDNSATGDNNDQRFCFWAALEGTTAKWYTATHGGNIEKDDSPALDAAGVAQGAVAQMADCVLP